MSKVSIVYWSGTGNTQKMAEAVAEGVKEAGAEADLKFVSAATVDELAAVWEGNTCGPKPTSCADQLIKALRAAQAEQAQ